MAAELRLSNVAEHRHSSGGDRRHPALRRLRRRLQRRPCRGGARGDGNPSLAPTRRHSRRFRLSFEQMHKGFVRARSPWGTSSPDGRSVPDTPLKITTDWARMGFEGIIPEINPNARADAAAEPRFRDAAKGPAPIRNA